MRQRRDSAVAALCAGCVECRQGLQVCVGDCRVGTGAGARRKCCQRVWRSSGRVRVVVTGGDSLARGQRERRPNPWRCSWQSAASSRSRESALGSAVIPWNSRRRWLSRSTRARSRRNRTSHNAPLANRLEPVQVQAVRQHKSLASWGPPGHFSPDRAADARLVHPTEPESATRTAPMRGGGERQRTDGLQRGRMRHAHVPF